MKFSLPNLNNDLKNNKRSLSTNAKYNKIKITKSAAITNNPIKKYSSQSSNHYNKLSDKTETEDNYKIDLLSTNSKSSNILIPIISPKNKINNYNYIKKENNKEDENIFKSINNKNTKKFNGILNNLEETNKNNDLNEIYNSYNKNKLIKKLNKRIFMENNNYNLLMSIDHSFMTKLHKIKIEKGMGNKLYEKMNKNILNNENYHLATFENHSTNCKLPLIDKLNERNSVSKIKIRKNKIN